MGSRNWCFTLNNYSEDDTNRLNNLVSSNSRLKYLIYGKEIGTSGTPHLQGFVTCATRTRLQLIKDILGGNPHLEPARNVIASIQYCKKDGDWVEFGERSSSQGKRTDIEDFKDAVKSGMLNLKDVRELHADVYAKYPHFCREYIRDNFPSIIIPEHTLRPWQTHLNQILLEEPNSRTVIFVVDRTGNSGKSWFADWFHKHQGDICQVITPGSYKDLAYMLNPGLKYLFMDAPRAKQKDHIEYDFLEDIKNGRINSSKYESTMKYYSAMHVVVLMNEEPDMEKLSRDRYYIINVEDFPNI